MIRVLTPEFAVSPQIDPADVTEIARAGYRMIVNNRPEGETPDQPSGDAIRTVAETLGLGYVEIPVTRAGFSHAQIDATEAAMTAGPVLAYCASGTRSCLLWALTAARRGDDPAEIAGRAAAAGYDVSPVAALIQALAAR